MRTLANITAEDGRARLPAAVLAGVSESLMSFEALFDIVMAGEYTTLPKMPFRGAPPESEVFPDGQKQRRFCLAF